MKYNQVLGKQFTLFVLMCGRKTEYYSKIEKPYKLILTTLKNSTQS